MNEARDMNYFSSMTPQNTAHRTLCVIVVFVASEKGRFPLWGVSALFSSTLMLGVCV
jgi:hypothetical protein